VYGLLGLVSDNPEEEPYVDYVGSLAGLSKRLSRYFVHHGSAASLLSHVVGLGRTEEPSRAVDFQEKSEKVFFNGLITADGKCKHSLFSAGRQGKPQIQLISDTDTIAVKDHLIGTLISQSNVALEYFDESNLSTSFRQK
jgi:hypothetical protein